MSKQDRVLSDIDMKIVDGRELPGTASSSVTALTSSSWTPPQPKRRSGELSQQHKAGRLLLCSRLEHRGKPQPDRGPKNRPQDRHISYGSAFPCGCRDQGRIG